MSTVTTGSVAEIRGCAEQPIRNKLLIEHALKADPEKTAKRRAWHGRFTRMRVNEPGGGARFIRCRDVGQRDLSKAFAAIFRTLHCADALTRASVKNALLTIGFGFQHSLSATFAPKRLVRTWFGIDPLNWRSVASLVNTIHIPRRASFSQPVDDLARHLPVHVSDTAAIQHRLALRGDERNRRESSRPWNDLVRTPGSDRRSIGVCPRGHSCESRYIAGDIA